MVWLSGKGPFVFISSLLMATISGFTIGGCATPLNQAVKNSSPKFCQLRPSETRFVFQAVKVSDFTRKFIRRSPFINICNGVLPQLLLDSMVHWSHTLIQPEFSLSEMIANSTILNRGEIKAVFRRNRGESARLAKELGISQQNITDWMKGHGRSQKVDVAIRARAAELLAAESGAAA